MAGTASETDFARGAAELRTAQGESPLGPPREWRIHLGAHKTATTHFQYTLLAARSTLQQAGLDFLPHLPTRPMLGRITGQPRWKRVINRTLLRRDPRAALLAFRERGDVVAFSEENLLGSCAGLLCQPLYPNFERGLSNLMAHTRGAPVRLFLSIRSFDRVLPAAYVTALRFIPPAPPEMSVALAAARQNPPRWTDLVDRIRRVAPQAELRVWRQEDYGQHRHKILSAFVGHDIDGLPNLPPPTGTLTPSAAAVAEVERMIADLLPGHVPADWTEQVDAIYARLPARDSADRFYPIEPALTVKLREAYSEDTETLQAAGLLIDP